MSFMPGLFDNVNVARLNKASAASKSRFSRLSLAATLFFACMSQNVFALGLGEIEVSSIIGQPLVASIPVLNADGIEQAELIVALGSATDYQIAGVTWDFSHSELQFDVSYAANGDLLVNVSSMRAIREPYLNLLVQARWPEGRLDREYTILLDFPVFTGDQNSAPSPQLVSGAPAVNDAAITGPQSLGEGDYRIQNGDTLWSLGGRVAQDLGVSRHQAMLAIREANPEAFTQGNLNLMRSGSVVRVPTRNAALSRSAAQALSEFAQAMSVSGQVAGATPLQSRATDFRNKAGSDQAGGAQLRLTSADQVKAALAGSGVDQIIEENQLLSDLNAALEEELQAASIENRDLSDRLQNLEEQNAVMEALIEGDNSEARAVQELVTAQPLANTITTADLQEEGLVSKLLGILPIVGLLVIGLLAGAYLVIRRRKSGDHAGDIARFDEDYEEDAPIYAEEKSSSEESIESAEPEEPVIDDFENFAVGIEEDTAEENIEAPLEAAGEHPLTPEDDDQEKVTLEAEVSQPAEEGWTFGFDDTASPEVESNSETSIDISAISEEAVDETIEESEEENDSEKNEIFDAPILAGAIFDNSGEESDAQSMDFSLDDDDLTTEVPEQEPSLDLSALLDEVGKEEERSPNHESSADQEDPLTSEEPSQDADDDLLGDFGDDDLDLSDVSDEGDIAEECETKLELAAAYIEMSDNSGAKELLDEVIREGDESFRARANELIGKMA